MDSKGGRSSSRPTSAADESLLASNPWSQTPPVEDAQTQPPSLIDLPPPPVYSGSVSNSTPRLIIQPGLSAANSGLGEIDFTKYVLPQSTRSSDQDVLTTSSPQFTSNPQALVNMIQEQASLPPRALLRIRGTHPDPRGGPYLPEKVDFDLTLNLMSLLAARPADQGLNYVQVQPIKQGSSSNHSSRELQAWAKRFCDDPAKSKSFSLVRQVTNLDTDYLEGQIRSAIASTRYRGKLEISFPLTFAKVVVYKGFNPGGAGLLGKFVEWTNPTKKYEVVQAVWPFATLPPGAEDETARRTAAVHSEREWWLMWKDSIRNAVLAKKVGYVTSEDWMEVMMGLKAEEPRSDWGSVNDW